MVGGGVRDLLAGITPKDFDVATSAHPEEVRKLFRSCRLVGRRFMIAHVRMGPEIVEVTTFRGPITDLHERDETGRILSDNVYGTLETDAFRRDFTINALYYDIRDYSIVDFAGGISDLQQKVVRLIGDPELRYREDPVRMLRAIRIANKLHFGLDVDAAEPMRRLAPLLGEIPPARLFDEVLKLLLCPEALENFDGMSEYGLLEELFPDTAQVIRHSPSGSGLVRQALGNTVERLRRAAPVTPAFLYAALLWPAVEARMRRLETSQGHAPVLALAQASEEILAREIAHVAIPKRFSVPMREIWLLQPRFLQRQPARAKRLLAHPRFRAAYDFLVLRAAAGNDMLEDVAQWWTQAQTGEFAPVAAAAEAPAAAGPARKRRRRRGPRREGGAGESPPDA